MPIDRRGRAAAAVAALQLLLGAPAAGQGPPPAPAPSPSPEVALKQPLPAAVDRAPRTVTVPGAPATGRDSATAGRFKAWRALALAEGEGRLLIDGAPRHVKTGDAVGGYVVKAVGPGRVVLADAESLAIITFDASGGARVRVVLSADPTRQKTVGLPAR